MADPTLRIGRLHLTAPDAASARTLGREVAEALHQALPTAGLAGKHDRVQVTLTPAQARDPQAVALAILRRLQGDGT